MKRKVSDLYNSPVRNSPPHNVPAGVEIENGNIFQHVFKGGKKKKQTKRKKNKQKKNLSFFLKNK